ncbi:hypothetical protein M0802_004740 [Mischocyttarus mexicanus]|nr:hypothetical protein M0802_004740 [Mischocyttarus mexicanus]
MDESNDDGFQLKTEAKFMGSHFERNMRTGVSSLGRCKVCFRGTSKGAHADRIIDRHEVYRRSGCRKPKGKGSGLLYLIDNSLDLTVLRRPVATTVPPSIPPTSLPQAICMINGFIMTMPARNSALRNGARA